MLISWYLLYFYTWSSMIFLIHVAPSQPTGPPLLEALKGPGQLISRGKTWGLFWAFDMTSHRRFVGFSQEKQLQRPQTIVEEDPQRNHMKWPFFPVIFTSSRSPTQGLKNNPCHLTSPRISWLMRFTQITLRKARNSSLANSATLFGPGMAGAVKVARPQAVIKKTCSVCIMC